MISLKEFIINEMLSSMDGDKLLRILNNHFKDYDNISVRTPKKKYFNKRGKVETLFPLTLYNEKYDELMEMLSKYMWVVSFVELQDPRGYYNYRTGRWAPEYYESGSVEKPYEDKYLHIITKKGVQYIYLGFEPLQSTDKTDYIYNDCKGIVWHLAPKKYLDNIKRNGLKLRNGETNKNYSKRLYVSCGKDDEHICNQLIELAKVLKDFDKEPENIIAIKADLNKIKHKVKFYEDTICTSDETEDLAFYTFESIPSNFLEYYEFNEIFKNKKFEKVGD